MSDALTINAEGKARMMYVGETPWHGMGQEVKPENMYDIEHCIVASDLDQPVALKALQTVDGQPIPERYTYDEKSGELFGCVGPRYMPLQNRDAFKWFQPWLDTKQVSLHTAGSLFKGQKIWVQAKLEGDNLEVRPGDEISSFVMLSNSHDGSTSLRVGFTPQRIVCNNTLQAAHNSDLSSLIRVRHNSNIQKNIDNIRDIMDLTRREFIATVEQYRLLASRDICEADLKKYVKIFFKEELTPDSELSTNKKNKIDKVMTRFHTEEKIAGATWWNAYNSVNFFLNHYACHNQENRLDSLWFGTNGSLDRKMFDIAVKGVTTATI